MSLAAWVTQAQTLKQCFKLLFSSFHLCFWECAWSGILNTQSCKDVRMSVDAGGGKLKSFQVAKGHQKSKQTSTLKIFFFNFRKCRDDSLVKKVWGQGRDGTYVQERPHVQLSTSHTHIKYSYMRCFEIDYSECCGYRIPDAVRLTCLW